MANKPPIEVNFLKYAAQEMGSGSFLKAYNLHGVPDDLLAKWGKGYVIKEYDTKELLSRLIYRNRAKLKIDKVITTRIPKLRVGMLLRMLRNSDVIMDTSKNSLRTYLGVSSQKSGLLENPQPKLENLLFTNSRKR